MGFTTRTKGLDIPSFGFEAEFQTGADAMCALLHSQGHLPDATMHGYHCDCHHCDIRNGENLRAQRDSSCSGEFITRPFSTIAEGKPTMLGLQTAAIEVDAEPGWDAGLHVHVDMSGVNSTNRHLLLWQFIEWEDVLVSIAAGRFSAWREDSNTTLGASLARNIRNRNGGYEPRSTATMARHLRLNDEYAWGFVPSDTYLRHQDSDRHSNLNVRTRYDTWEFRLWNSTRSAWRMELWAWLSIAFADRALLRRLTAATTEEEPSVELLHSVLFDNRYPEAAVLLDRQHRYMQTRGTPADGEDFPVEPAFTLAV